MEGVQINTGGWAHYGFATDGSLVYLSGVFAADSERTLAWVDKEGREEILAFPPDAYGSARLSPDGTRVAVSIDAEGNRDVWVGETTRGTLTRLTSDPAGDGFPVWSPDGQRVVFRSERDGELGLYRMAADGTGSVELIVLDNGRVNNLIPFDWSIEGDTLLVSYDAIVGETYNGNIVLWKWMTKKDRGAARGRWS